MNRCRDCKHWGVPGTFTLPNGSVHEYGARPFGAGVKQCRALEAVLEQDGEPFGGNAALGTPADFGCVLFEQQPMQPSASEPAHQS